jgi:PmbA protein
MNTQMLELATWSIETAKAAGADASRVSINGNRSVEIGYRERKPETIKEATTRGLSIEIFVKGRYSAQSTSDLRKDALKAFIMQAVASTKLLAEDPFRSLPDAKWYEGQSTIDLKTTDPQYSSFSPEDRHQRVKEMEEACLAKGGPKVVSASAGLEDGRSEWLLVSSNGFQGYNEATYYSQSAEMTAQDQGDRKPNGYSYAVGIARKNLPAPEQTGAMAAQRTLDLLGAKKIKTEVLPIIVENQNVGRILSGLIAATYGRSIQQKQSFLADKKGSKIASDKLTLIDDPLLVGGLSSRLFDGDGIAAKRRTIIDAGVLKDYFVDWYYGRKLGWEPTTGGPSNLIIPPGKRSVKAIMQDLKRGIFITGFIGGNSNSTTGDTSFGIFGTLFENGELVQPIAEMNIAGNHLEFWHKFAEAADDPWPYSSWQMPSLVFTDVMVSGV